MELVYLNLNYSIYKYKPTLMRPFYLEMETTTLMRRIRFMVDYLYGYSVYYLKVNEKFVGYCTITSGKNRRFWFSGCEDIIIGPYYIDPSFRGMGYSTMLVNIIINLIDNSWKNAYLYILNENIASIRVVEKLGGQLQYHIHNTFYRKLVKDDNGEYGIYKIERENV